MNQNNDFPQYNSAEEVLEALESKDVETAKAFGMGAYEHLFNAESQSGGGEAPQEPVQTQQEQEIPRQGNYSEEPEITPEKPVREPDAESEEPSDEEGEEDGLVEIDPELARQRELEEIKRQSNSKLTELEARLAEQDRRMKEQEKEFQKKLAEERRNLSVFDDEEDVEDAGEDNAPQYKAPEGDNHIGDSPVDDVREELRKLKAEREYDRAVSEYASFWDGEGRDLKPSVEPRHAIDALKKYFNDAVSSIGDKDGAVLGLRDIAYGVKSTQAEKVKKSAGDPPRDFDKVFKSWEVELYAGGNKINPAKGSIDTVSKGMDVGLGDAYMLFKKEDPGYSSKKKAMQDVQKQLNKKRSSAVTPSPSDYQPHARTSRYEDPQYTRALLKRARNSGLDHRMNPSTIKDPAIRKEYEDYKQFMKTLGV